ncbi:MAG: DNA modification methylase [Planctomycetota bacterium]|nr:MAG: DNA modification methylase [Planctomycetota bacterium]
MGCRSSLFAPEAQVEEIEIGGYRVPRISNEWWGAQQRQGHSLHEISYRACFKGELPAFWLSRLSKPQDVVLDPFMGRGTTLVEAALRGRVPWGLDLNPLSQVLVAPRLAPPVLHEVEDRLRRIEREPVITEKVQGEPDLSPFYEEKTLSELRRLRHWFQERADDTDHVDRWLRMVATNRLTGHSSGFFSGRTMPPNQAVSIETQRKLNERNGEKPPRRKLPEIIQKKTRSLLRSLDLEQRRRLEQVQPLSRLEVGDASEVLPFEDGSVDCTITSPPFLDVINYAGDNWLRCWFNGIDPERVAAKIKALRSVEAWSAVMGQVFEELYRVTRPGGHVVFEVGEVKRGTVRLEEYALPVAIVAGFDPICVAIQVQDFTKTANCWGVDNNNKGTNTQRMIVLHKDES